MLAQRNGQEMGQECRFPPLKKAKAGASEIRVVEWRSRAQRIGHRQHQVYSLVRSRHGYLISPLRDPQAALGLCFTEWVFARSFDLTFT